MQKKLTLQEYANIENISLVTVNKRVKKGLVNSIKEGNRRYIIVDVEESEVTKTIDNNKHSLSTNLETLYEARIQDLERVNKQYLKQIKELNKQINKQLEINDHQMKDSNKRIQELEKEIKELNKESKDVYKQFIGEMKTLLAPPVPTEKPKKKKKK